MQVHDTKLYPVSPSCFQPVRLSPDAQNLCKEIVGSFNRIDYHEVRTKCSREKTMLGSMLVSPKCLNQLVKDELTEAGWKPLRHSFTYISGNKGHGSYEADFFKNGIACELQLGKYAFMASDVLKLRYLWKKGMIQLGVLVVPSKQLQSEMSTGPGCFQQVEHLLDEQQLDLPLLVLSVGE